MKKTESPKKEVFPKVNHLLSAELGLKPHPELFLLQYDSFYPQNIYTVWIELPIGMFIRRGFISQNLRPFYDMSSS